MGDSAAIRPKNSFQGEIDFKKYESVTDRARHSEM